MICRGVSRHDKEWPPFLVQGSIVLLSLEIVMAQVVVVYVLSVVERAFKIEHTLVVFLPYFPCILAMLSLLYIALEILFKLVSGVNNLVLLDISCDFVVCFFH